jgi:Cu-processing system ATP-binding protein
MIARFPENLTGADLSAMSDLRSDVSTRDEELVDRSRVAHSISRCASCRRTRQKVNAALAFLFAPALLILDEPTAGLDPVASGVVKDKIAARERGATFVLTRTS